MKILTGLVAGSAVALLMVGVPSGPAAAGVIACTSPAGPIGDAPAEEGFNIGGNTITGFVDCGEYVETRSGNDAGGPLDIGGVSYDQELKIEFETGAAQSGEWGPLDFNALYLVIKAGTNFSIYFLGEDGANEGFWATAPTLLVGNGNVPTISHLSFYGRGTPVSEPAMVALMGAGLLGLGLARVRRRRG